MKGSFRKSMRTAWLHGRRRIDRYLFAHQRFVWRSALFLALVVVVLLFFQFQELGRDIATFVQYGRRNRIAFKTPRPPSLPATPSLTPPPQRGDATGSNFALSADGVPILNWHKNTHLHRAATALAQKGDLEAAVALLMQGGPDDLVLREVAETAFASLRHHLPEAIRTQLDALRGYWQALSPMERRSYFPAAQRARADQLNERLAALSGTSRLDPIYEFLPISLQYWLLSTIHLSLVEASQCPADVVELVLEFEVSEKSVAKQMYWLHKPSMPLPSADQALGIFSEALNKTSLWPVVKRFLAAQKQAMAKMPRVEAVWFRDTCGSSPTQALWKTDLAALTPDRAANLWKKFPDDVQQLWGDRVYRAWRHAVAAGLEIQNMSPKKMPHLAPIEMRANLWLQHVDDPVNKTFLVRAVRSHPQWQLLLREFRHPETLAAIPGILQRLHAGKYADLVHRWLAVSVNYEQEEMIRRGFSWRFVARAVRAENPVPPGIAMEWARRQGRDYEPELAAPGRRWLDVSPARVYDALRLLAARKTAAEKARYELIAKTFAMNRNYEPNRNSSIKQ